MLMKNYQTLFLLFLVSGTLMAISSSSWFICWLGLEINLMSLIPLILSELNFKSTEAAIKYFLAQAMASIILMVMACTEMMFEMNTYLSNTSFLIFAAMAIKAGMAPFHFWFPQVMNCVSWLKCFIILTWQKLAPFILMSCFMDKILLINLMVTAASIGALGGLNQINNKLILTYSSIAHSAWMIMMTYISLSLWVMYFSIYVLILTPIIFSFFKLNLSKITEINKSKMSSANKNMLVFLILSLGGLPPFLGFTAKMMAIMLGMKIMPMVILFIMILSSLISLFYYTKLFYTLSMNSTSEFKFNMLNEVAANKMLISAVAGNLIMSSMVLLI